MGLYVLLLDPVGALKEQRRVAKKGSWVIAGGVRDHLIGLRYFGAETKTNSVLDLLLLDDPKSPQEEQLVLVFERTIAAGYLDRVTLERAKEEARAWYSDPTAFHTWIDVFAAGRAQAVLTPRHRLSFP